MRRVQQRHETFLCITMVVVAGFATVAGAAQHRFPETEVDEQAMEWIEITVHMPDGRTFTRHEQRFPSRSRVLIQTGIIPAFTPVPGNVVATDTASGDEDTTSSEIVDLEPSTPAQLERDEPSEPTIDPRSDRVFKKTPRS